MKPRTRVAVAVIIRDGRLLIGRRRAHRDFPRHWECPGGKVEHGETDEQALRRELREELGVESLVGEPVVAFYFDTPITPVDCVVTFYQTKIIGEPQALDHDELLWAVPCELSVLPLTPANDMAQRALTNMMNTPRKFDPRESPI